MHELGHAINFEKSDFFNLCQNLRGLGPAVLSFVAFLSPVLIGFDGEKENIIEKNAGIIGFAAFLPTILEEGAASIKAIKAAQKNLPNTNLKILKTSYFLAWMTYVLSGVVAGLATKMILTEEQVSRINIQRHSKR